MNFPSMAGRYETAYEVDQRRGKTDSVVCCICGAFVMNIDAHDWWHTRVELPGLPAGVDAVTDPGPVIAYLVDGKVWHPSDVTIVRSDARKDAPSMTAHLIAFLTARLDEDETAARKAAAADGRFGGRAHWSALGHGIVTDATHPDWGVVDLGPCIDDDALAEHIALHDPARVLREAEADRRLLAEWQKAEADPAVDDQWNAGLAAGLRLAVQIRAARHSDHPDYRPEWKP